MSSKFKYDIVALIELVESRACLWDKTTEDFKDREMKNKLWLEVYSFLEPNFLQLDRKEQIKVGNLIKDKWNNIRDAFARSLRKKSGQAATKKYLYNDVLQFLLKTTDKDETESTIRTDDNNETAETQEEETETVAQQREYEEMSTSGEGVGKRPPLRKRVTPMNDEIDRKILKSLEKIEPNEDEAFFISVLPSLRAFSADDKLDFRMGVLKLIKDIKNRSAYISSPIFTQTASPNNSHSTGNLSLSPCHETTPGNILTFLETTRAPTSIQTYLNLNDQSISKQFG